MVGIRIDELRFVRDSISEHIRSEYRYSLSNSIETRLFIENWEHNTEIIVCNPSNLEYASITPSATITKNPTITDTIPVIYDLRLNSNSSKQYLTTSMKQLFFTK
ncbi:MAG: hypothetical protein ACFFB5_20885 [Promethearchaeota archaeon]